MASGSARFIAHHRWEEHLGRLQRLSCASILEFCIRQQVVRHAYVSLFVGVASGAGGSMTSRLPPREAGCATSR